MIYVDTSVLIRYLTADDPVRTPAAMAIIESPEPRAISIIAVLEASHVLRSAYGYERGNIAAALIALITRRNVVVPELDKEHVLLGLEAWRRGSTGSPGDALIAASMSARGADAIATFDTGFPAGAWAVLSGPQA
ncbi:MAG: PIN domain-containing protein [Chloroflexi bacterium]|nr:PIN domain-containing protein [Chloroflexota bacterium]